jgi:DNA-binding Lrp family transcriptional regulator
VIAYVLVDASSGRVDELTASMAEVHPAVEWVRVVAGDVDYIVKIDVAEAGAIHEVTAGLLDIDDIDDTLTYVAME